MTSNAKIPIQNLSGIKLTGQQRRSRNSLINPSSPYHNSHSLFKSQKAHSDPKSQHRLRGPQKQNRVTDRQTSRRQDSQNIPSAYPAHTKEIDGPFWCDDNYYYFLPCVRACVGPTAAKAPKKQRSYPDSSPHQRDRSRIVPMCLDDASASRFDMGKARAGGAGDAGVLAVCLRAWIVIIGVLEYRSGLGGETSAGFR